jgi:hypothetical protein
MAALTQQLQFDHVDRVWKINKLPAVLAGDVVAAAISATLISPVITAIDR